MTENYPYWYCPVFACGYRTQYKNNIEKHLKDVHNWQDWKIKLEIRKFEKAHYHDIDLICEKDQHDPTKPKTKGRC